MRFLSFLALLLFFISILSCRQTTGKTGNQDTTVSLNLSKNQRATLKENEVLFDTLMLPNEQDAIARVQEAGGVFHDGEVLENIAELDWVGLFKNTEGYFLKSTRVSTKREKDEIVDDDSEVSGWVVETGDNENCSLLLNGIENLEDGLVDSFIVSRKTIWPNESTDINVNGEIYTLSAMGKVTQTSAEWKEVKNYKLYLTHKNGGKETKQLIVAIPEFNDAMVTILWCGDLDRDGKPDFIIDTSSHYNASSKSLFLSSRAAPGDLVRYVGTHSTTGC